jgi:hypothetical protein
MSSRYTKMVAVRSLPFATFPAYASCDLEQEMSQIFAGRSFSIRNFYRGGHLRYGSDGQLLGKAESGYWSRDGMVDFSPEGFPTRTG